MPVHITRSMVASGSDLQGFQPSDTGGGMPRVLVVVLHGWRSTPTTMDDVTAAVRRAFSPAVALDLFVPLLPHAKTFSTLRAVDTVKRLVKNIDVLVERRGAYDEIILVGHSMGATIARRLFLAAVGPLPGFRAEAPLGGEAERSWAKTVTRIVLISAFNRGWQISERLSWYYSTLFNAIGLFGHVMSLASTPAIFDIRLGAPFIVQTRLHWLAYRRNRGAGTGPLLIQLIGSRDDLISPFDQVDIAVDGLGQDIQAPDNRRHVPSTTVRDFYMLRLPQTGHKDSIDFTGSLGATPALDAVARAITAARRAALVAALTDDRPALAKIAADPDLMSDQVARPDSAVLHTVFVIHGIRDDGFWTHRIAERIRDVAQRKGIANARTQAWTPTYGYFAMLPFMLPWIRQLKVEWFMDQYVSASAQYPNAIFDFVGHSNGTYVGARALRDYADCHFRHVYFAGSVVQSGYDWIEPIAGKRVHKVLNVVATRDSVVALLPKSVSWWPNSDLGGAGFDGFVNPLNPTQVTNCRYVEGSHGAGIVEGHWSDIAEFIVNGTAMVPRNEEPPLFGPGQPAWLRWAADLRLTMSVIVVVFAFCPALALIAWFGWRAAFLFLSYCVAAAFVVTRL